MMRYAGEWFLNFFLLMITRTTLAKIIVIFMWEYLFEFLIMDNFTPWQIMCFTPLLRGCIACLLSLYFQPEQEWMILRVIGCIYISNFSHSIIDLYGLYDYHRMASTFGTSYFILTELYRCLPKPAKPEAKPQTPILNFDNGQCAICLDQMEETKSKLQCGHVFCFECLMSWCRVKLECPTCRTSFTNFQLSIRDLNISTSITARHNNENWMFNIHERDSPESLRTVLSTVGRVSNEWLFISSKSPFQ